MGDINQGHGKAGNRYSVCKRVLRYTNACTDLDADPKEQVNLIDDAEYRQEMVNHNYELGKVYYSYKVLRRKLRTLVFQLTGEDILN